MIGRVIPPSSGEANDRTIIDAHAGDDLSPLVGRWQVDPTHSTIEFVARYAVFTRVRGRFTSFTGTVDIETPHPAGTRIELMADAAEHIVLLDALAAGDLEAVECLMGNHFGGAV